MLSAPSMSSPDAPVMGIGTQLGDACRLGAAGGCSCMQPLLPLHELPALSEGLWAPCPANDGSLGTSALRCCTARAVHVRHPLSTLVCLHASGKVCWLLPAGT